MRPNPRASLWFVAFLLTLAIPSHAAAQADTKLYELRGKVVSVTTAEPVPGALLQIAGQPARFSDSDGTFAFPDLPAGRVNITVRKPGFFTEQQLGGGMAFEPSVEVPSNGEVLLKLTPEAILFGEVKNADGEPVEGITVRAERWRLEEGRRQLRVEKQATTDDQGKFRIPELVPGTYYLAFLPQGNRTFVGSLSRKPKPQEGYGVQFYPGVADAQAATPFPVRAGANVHVAHNFVKQRLFQVSGTVRGDLPHRMFDITLSNSLGEQVPANPRIDPSTGEFQIPGLTAGGYLLTATRFPVQDSAGVVTEPPLTATQTVFVDRDISGVVLILGAGISIPVQVHEEFSSDASDAHQVNVHALGQSFVQNSAAVTVPPPPGGRRSADKLENLSPDTYWVEAQPNAPQDYVAELRCGSLDLLRDPLVIAPNASLPPIEVTLRNDSAQLTVALKQKDRPAAILIYSSDYPRASRLLPFFAGNASSVVNLPPGRYQVVAFAGVADFEYRNPQAVEKYLPHAVAVTLQPRDNTTISLDVQDSQEQPE